MRIHLHWSSLCKGLADVPGRFLQFQSENQETRAYPAAEWSRECVELSMLEDRTLLSHTLHT